MKLRQLKISLWLLAFCGLAPFSFGFDQQLDLRVSGATTDGEPGKEWGVMGNIYARYTLKNEDNADIKGVFSLNANAGTEWSNIGVYQAYMKVRFNDYFRMTFGKAPVTWGEGVYYNAGDIFFDSSNTGIMLSSLEIRDNSQWMTDMYFSLGRYSYFQIVAVLPTQSGFSLEDNKKVMPVWKDSSAGWRIGGKVGDAQMQVGGAYKGDKTWYTSYFSLTTGIADLMDMYLDTRISVGKGLMEHNDYKKTWEITGGLSYSTSVDAGMFSVRLETIFRPFQNWKSINNPNNSDIPVLEGDTSKIGLYNYYGNEIYLEVGGNITSALSMFVRNVFSTIDISDYMSLMITYSPLDKFSISLNAGVQMGSKYDLFSFRKAGATSIYFMARYVYE